jgi:hypothetical protein
MSRTVTYWTLALMLGVKPALAQNSLPPNGGDLNGVNVTAGLSQNGTGVYYQLGYNGGSGGAAPGISLTMTGSSLTGNNSTSASFRTTDRLAALFQQTNGGAGAEGTSGHNGQDGGASGAITTTVTNTSLRFNYLSSTAMPLVYGLYAGSLGASGGPSEHHDYAGGNGSAAAQVNLTLNGSNVTMTSQETTVQGAAVTALQQGGGGGTGEYHGNGGLGGGSAPMAVTVQDSTITAQGGQLVGLQLIQNGGTGGEGPYNTSDSNAGTGGILQGITLTLQQSDGGAGNTISTTGSNAPAIQVTATGGNGGEGSEDQGGGATGGDGGNGGNTVPSATDTAITISSTDYLSIATQGSNSAGINALSQGGAGGIGGDTNDLVSGHPGHAGTGGRGDQINIHLRNGATITTHGDSSSAIRAQTQGGAAGSSGNDGSDASGSTTHPGGTGGNSGLVTVTLDQGVTLNTAGTGADGVTALSISGNGGYSGTANGGLGTAAAGNGGNGGVAGGVDITSAASIKTTGANSRGIMAQTVSGIGGTGGNAGALFSSDSGGPGNAGSVNGSTVTHSGTITTGGDYSQGILVQSIAGAGGVGGDAGGSLFNDQGGQATTGSNGGTIEVTNTGTITTAGESAQAIVAQSIGGGGGYGGPAGGVFYSRGGDAGAGGNGNTVTLTLGGTLTTSGTLAHGAVAQSVGGSGGMGGNAYSAGALEAAAVGGSGGQGGNGGSVDINANGLSLTTTGSGAAGLVAQSVGGGGGTGGSAYSTAVGPFLAVSTAVGGSGGNGGAGGPATVALADTTIQAGGVRTVKRNSLSITVPTVDSIGVVVQSVGGGGGNGGGASALAVAIDMPVPTELPVDEQSTTPSIAVASAVGGSGGSGGAGQAASLSMSGSSTITTAGDGSHGALVQSIGGGGGNGGDSSSLAATVGYGTSQWSKLMPPDESLPTQGSFEADVSVAVGGSCSQSADECVGGSGGAATFTLGSGSSITTQNGGAFGALVQSIGGGGGNAGLGSANTTSIGTSSTHDITVSVGQTGGTGGHGGTVTATIDQGGSISTTDAGSIGLAAQSIGGGGGAATGTGVSLSGLFTGKGTAGQVTGSISLNPSVTVGNHGGTGGDGGTVTVTHNGSITTRGADAPGILAQSIGGGGGVGGTAGVGNSADVSGTSSASNANTSSALALMGDDENGTTLPTFNFHPTVNIGGRGGAGGVGSTVTVNQSGDITTVGDYSPGIVAQSIGGGGGRGGVAVLTGTQSSLLSDYVNSTFQTNLGLGNSGVGGAGANGGPVTINLNAGSILTGNNPGASSGNGFQAYGILAQSVGGGGGTGGDGSIIPSGNIFLGGGFSGNGGASGDGGAVTLQSNDTVTPLPAIGTQGDSAHGIVLQSVGGGGGVAGSGSSLGIGITAYAGTVTPTMGGGVAGAGGSGGAVTMTPSAGFTVTTSGNGAIGLLAQSVGGGGGIYAAVPGTNVAVQQLGGAQSTGNGGTVSMQLTTPGSTVSTSGVGAHAVVAQSVGGGGGLVTSYGSGETPGLLADAPVAKQGASTGTGGSVTVNSAASLITTGAGAHGIVAQSIGGGGGLIGLGANSAGGGGTFLGSTGRGSGSGGTVNVSVSDTVQASGANAIGIFAQSTGPSGGSTVTVAVNGTTVTGGSGTDGAAIVISGGNSNVVTMDSGATVSAASNTAIRQVGNGLTNVQNAGTIYGSTYLSGGSVSGNQQIESAPAEVALMGAAEVAPRGTLTNYGTLAARAGQVSVIGGHLVQGGTGRLVSETDFVNRSAGSFQVLGDASLNGFVRPQLVSVLPDVRLPVLRVSGSTTGSLAVEDTALFSFRLDEANGQHELSVAGAHFRQPEFHLDSGRQAMAGALESMFYRGNEAYGAFFAQLDAAATANPSLYAAHLHQLSPRAVMTSLAQPAFSATDFADASMSCPVFADGYIGSQSFLTEGECAYFRPGLRTSRVDGDTNRGALTSDTATWQLGGQTEVAPGLFLGGSLAYETNWMRAGDGVKADGSAGLGAVTIKYQTGPVLLTGAVFGSAGSLDLQRPINVPSYSLLAKGSTSAYSAGVRARVAYTVGGEGFYLRPYLNLDVIHAHTDAFRENGASALGFAYGDSSYTTGILTPALEVGGRFVLGPQSVLRGFVSVGVSLRSNDEWRGRVSLLGASPDGGTFSLGVPTDRAAGRLSAGLQLFQGEQFDLRAQYDGTYGDHTHTHGGSLTFAYRF